ncbi:SHOCT domain-containing protein [Mycolicibacterium sp. CBM1]
MMWRAIAARAVLWWALIVGSAVVATALLGHSGPVTAKGWALGVWVGGYVAQFVVFLAIARRSPRPVPLGWAIASIVPWAADWTAPLSLWWLALWSGLILAYAARLVAAVSRVDRLRAAGVPATAVILGVVRPTFTAVASKDAARRVVRLRVERPDGAAPYEARLAATFALGEIPEPDDRVAVRLDPDRPELVELIEDAPIVRACPPPVDLAPAVAEQLRRLTTMRDRGDLTDAEFATARRRLFES